jgi:SAM-dependent methyltransferase
MAIAPTRNLAEIKSKQHAAWARGDYAEIGTLIVPVAERLADAADLRAGWDVLDVACGSGNMALAAARLGCTVTGVDYVGASLERAAERAAAERLDAAFAYGDAEELPFADDSFDATASVMGAMFSADHERAAEELLRVTRPGGTIALASWSPVGFVGAMFWAMAERVPPTDGLPLPMLWGTADYLEEIFGPDVTWRHRRQTFTFRFASADAFVDRFATHYGPTIAALDAAGCDRDALADDLRALALMWNRLEDDGPVAVPATYLESVGITRV